MFGGDSDLEADGGSHQGSDADEDGDGDDDDDKAADGHSERTAAGTSKRPSPKKQKATVKG